MAHHKLSLDEKICVACKRPFKWRKKWARDWSNVKFCSQRCKQSKTATHTSALPTANLVTVTTNQN
ncbi:MAG TPA: DUF2256 domain-containing protein [Gammaproteobacteria bacterium]|nr:DUF2256 domain-containing protein [Gammaproteobacteria bacterium]